MQKIKKTRGLSRQLSETINFAFMKIFGFLVKIANFRASLLFSGDSRHAFPLGSHAWFRGSIMGLLDPKWQQKSAHFP